MDRMLLLSHWESIVFPQSGDAEQPAIGQRLGVQYLKAVQEHVEVKVKDLTLTMHQDSMGLMAIAGAVWDAGMNMVDFLVTWENESEAGVSEPDNDQLDIPSTSNSPDLSLNKFNMGNVLDLGCGTGICGIVAALLGAKDVVCSDCIKLSCFDENVDELPTQLQERVSFVYFDWYQSDKMPHSLLMPGCKESESSGAHGADISSFGDESLSKPAAGDQRDAITVSSTINHGPLLEQFHPTQPHASLLGTKTVLGTKGGATKSPASSFSVASTANDVTSGTAAPAAAVRVDPAVWDTVLCSDVVYEEKIHEPLLAVLRRLRFRRLFLSYKKRRDDADRKFFTQLAESFTLQLVDPTFIKSSNLPPAALAELYIFHVTPRVI